jgi:hypothetical protein
MKRRRERGDGRDIKKTRHTGRVTGESSVDDRRLSHVLGIFRSVRWRAREAAGDAGRIVEDLRTDR